MGDGAGYAGSRWTRRSRDSGLEEKDIFNPRTGLIVGSGGPSTKAIVAAADTARASSPKRIGPFAVPKAMSSTCSANLSTWFKTKGVNYSISPAPARPRANCIGNAAEMIQWGKQDVMFAGGGEELDWTLSELFDAMGAMSSKYNATPEKASRAYDKNRDGFVISGGGGILVLEELEHAKARGAKIYAELVGYGATADGADMVAPSGEGAVRCMQMALKDVKAPIDYINPHATSTPVGDIPEINAIREVFGNKMPPISATKSLTGHSQGAAGVQEAIYTLVDDAIGLHLRKRQYRGDRSGGRRAPTSCASASTMRKSRPRFPTVSASAARTRRWYSSGMTLECVSDMPAVYRLSQQKTDPRGQGQIWQTPD